MRASNTKNYGSLMMVANYIRVFKSKYPKSTFIVDNVEIDGVERIKASSGVEEIESFLELGIQLRPDCSNENSFNKLIKYSKYSLSFGRMMKDIGVDRVIQLGGDDFSEYYSIKALCIELLKIESLLKNNIKVQLLGQTMGPFYSWRKWWIKKLLNKVSIYSRDENSAKYLIEELQLKNVKIAADLAYLPLYKQDTSYFENFPEHKLGSFKDYFVIVPSGLWKSYTSDLDSYVNSYLSLINHLTERGENVLILSHVLSDTSSDNKIIEKIQERIEHSPNVKFIKETLLPVEARALIAKSKCVVSGRMHACVSALQVGVPAVPLSYSVKFKGVIGELNIIDRIIDSVGDDLWRLDGKASPIVNSILSEIDSLESTHDKTSVLSQIQALEHKILTQF